MLTDRRIDGRRTPRDCISSWNELTRQQTINAQRRLHLCTVKVPTYREIAENKNYWNDCNDFAALAAAH